MSDTSSFTTTEHWFLDLDGVRSGPYQTPEILSLVADGEVLPHHKISTALKDQPWTTVLEWRLEQAKKPAERTREIRSYIPESAKPPPSLPPETKIEIAPLIEPAVAVPPATPSETAERLTSELKIEIKIDEEPQTRTLIKPVTAQTYKPSVEPSPAAEGPPPKRDPTAEMFDLLQNSKQKREAKSQQAQQNQTQALAEAVGSERNSGYTRTIVIGLIITAVGFGLGQVFQQSSPPVTTATPSPAAVTAKAESPTPRPTVIDRSTDKITIRKVDPTPAAVPPKAATPAMAAHSPQNPRELEELKDLKKELQELKALKDELRSAPRIAEPMEVPSDPESPETGAPEGLPDSGFNYYPAAPAQGSGGVILPDSGNPEDPNAPASEAEIHY